MLESHQDKKSVSVPAMTNTKKNSKKGGATGPQKSDSRDKAVQQTNDDSVVSKRSAVYHNYMEDPYLRHFVKKLSRRSPLINRGYYLRMLVITDVVSRCIRHLQSTLSGAAPVQVVSLGAGFDTLALRLKELPEFDDVHFYEVDFPEVMQCKAELIRAAPAGAFPADFVADPAQKETPLRGGHYAGVGLDLREAATKLCDALSRAEPSFAASNPTVCYAECVMQYMPPQAAAELMQLVASTFSQGLFLAYDQVNPSDSFGRVMQQSLRMRGSPLLGIADAPDGSAMLRRAHAVGFHGGAAAFANFHDLSRHYLAGAELRRVEALETFDESEEWCEMCEHYGLTLAATSRDVSLPTHPAFHAASEDAPVTKSFENHVAARVMPWPSGRFGFAGWGSGDVFAEALDDGDRVLVVFGGFSASQGHRRTSAVHVHSLRDGDFAVTATGDEPPALVFHSMSRVSRGTYVVFGGRTNPTDLSNAAYLLQLELPKQREATGRVTAMWSRIATPGPQPLPPPRQRHVALVFPCSVDSEGKRDGYVGDLVVFGGAGEGGALLGDAWRGRLTAGGGCIEWLSVSLTGSVPSARSAASAAAISAPGQVSRQFVLSGGRSGNGEAGVVECDGGVWCIDVDAGVCCRAPGDGVGPRMAHTMSPVRVDGKDALLVLGGTGPAPRATNIAPALLLDARSGAPLPRCVHFHGNEETTWVRHTCVTLADGVVAVVGGGFTCFSFGTFAPRPCLLLLGDATDSFSADALLPAAQPVAKVEKPLIHAVRPILAPVPFTPEVFYDAVRHPTRPVLFRGVNLGRCLSHWPQPAYLKEAERDTVVSVHVARHTHLLDFVQKNFSFRHVPFSDLVDHCVAAADGNNSNSGEAWYLRSIANNMKSERANVWKDFSGIGSDFQLPPEAWEHIGPRMHQSCLRLNAAPLQIWTHYDTLDNVLCQITGRKRVVLFPPSEYNNLYMSGSSSAVLNLDAPDLVRYPRFADACRHAVEVQLEPGDMLFFPALWPHHITTVGDTYSISVNVFFERLPHDDYDRKDLYGNKDLPAAVRLRQAIVQHTQELISLEGRERTSDGAPLTADFVEFALRQAIQDLEGIAGEMAAASRATSRD